MSSSPEIDHLEVGEPPVIDPYKVLGLDKSATPEQVKSAYRRAALKSHPDKAKDEDKQQAHTRFQEIALAYAVLSDPTRRKRYDATGRTDESLDLDDDDFDWASFYREQFADVINPDSIARFSQEYKGSDEEREALLAAYTDFEGDMDQVYEYVMVSNPADDDERFRDILNAAIEEGGIESFPTFTKETKKSIKARIKAAKDEGNEAEEYAKELGVHDQLFTKNNPKKSGKKSDRGSEDALAALIQQRQKGRSDNFLADLEAKYAAPSRKKNGKKRAEPLDEPPEEAFQATAKKSRKTK
ncbi:hypothetical protein AAFC00_004765 [Neodothiora populina]|uniref:J domain-containing protein n=1 Tax=Neodothiora populina TaxID=2781224 RepID=A0ABR3P3J4_9PEZI